MLTVLLLVLTVHILLLTATGKLLGAKESPIRILLGAGLGTVFAAVSLIPGFDFLGHFLWRLCSLVLSALLTFGISYQTVPKLFLFLLLHFSLGGVTDSRENAMSMALGAAGICFACIAVGKRQMYVPVKLTYKGKTVTLTALLDTGNTLHDPLTGGQVLVVGADVAKALTGLTPAALRDPVGSLGVLPGLRLIPYQTVGNKGFLLAVSVADARIGDQLGSTIVAFSPLSFNEHYQGLTGGYL